MAEANAAIALQNHLLSRDDRQQVVLEELRRALTLPGLPNRIEGYDISHVQGSEQVGSMVVWENGSMKKDDYKRFRIKSVAEADVAVRAGHDPRRRADDPDEPPQEPRLGPTRPRVVGGRARRGPQGDAASRAAHLRPLSPGRIRGT